MMTSTCLLSALLILSHLSTLRVYAQKLYPVYYDPNNEPSRNPKGDGYLPVGPNDWDLVVSYFKKKTAPQGEADGGSHTKTYVF